MGMNIIVKLFFIVFFSLTSIYSISYSKEEDKKKMIGKVVLIRGKVLRLAKEEKTEEILQLNDHLFSGDTVKTAKGSIVRISFIDETIFNIGSDSLIQFKDFQISSNKKKSKKERRYQFIMGQLRAKFFPRNDNTKNVVETRFVSMGVRGTEILVNSIKNKNEDHITQVALLTGSIDILNRINSKKHKLTAGKQLISIINKSNTAFGMQFIDMEPTVHKRLVAQSNIVNQIPQKISADLDGGEMLLGASPPAAGKRPSKKRSELKNIFLNLSDNIKIVPNQKIK